MFLTGTWRASDFCSCEMTSCATLHFRDETCPWVSDFERSQSSYTDFTTGMTCMVEEDEWNVVSRMDEEKGFQLVMLMGLESSEKAGGNGEA